MLKKAPFDVKNIENNMSQIALMLKCLSNEKRLAIACELCDGEKNVGMLEAVIGLSQSALSQHLARMRRDGVVTTRREAQTIFYSLDNNDVFALLGCLGHVMGAHNSGKKAAV